MKGGQAAYAVLLTEELRGRRHPGNFGCRADVKRVGGDWEEGLSAAAWLLAKTVAARPEGQATRVGRELVAVEACLHLRNCAEAAWHLEAALQGGACQPVVYLALDCSTFAVAGQAYTDPAGAHPGRG